MVAGHEGAGVVEIVGSSVTLVAVGDHVVRGFTPSCGSCRYCSTGRQNLCVLGANAMVGRLLDDTLRFHADGDPGHRRALDRVDADAMHSGDVTGGDPSGIHRRAQPVGTPHPASAAVHSGIQASKRTTDCWGTVARWENVPSMQVPPLFGSRNPQHDIAKILRLYAPATFRSTSSRRAYAARTTSTSRSTTCAPGATSAGPSPSRSDLPYQRLTPQTENRMLR
jgi:hypothetical protein